MINSKNNRLILASSSPRRREILENIGVNVEIIPSNFEENLDKNKFTAIEYVIETAYQKALEVQKRLDLNDDMKTIIIGADTVVVHNDCILEKPDSKDDAIATLNRLSDNTHSVHTGVILLCGDKCIKFHESTQVKFAKLSQDLIRRYVETGEPMDKAGSYGIQAMGGLLVEYIHGCYFNVVGFPVYKFGLHLKELLNE